MKRKGLVKAALARGIRAETSSVRQRIARADRVLGVRSNTDTVVREGVSLPRGEAESLDQVIERLFDKRIRATKSEIFRIGLQLVGELSDENLIQRVQDLPKRRRGRPPAKVEETSVVD